MKPPTESEVRKQIVSEIKSDINKARGFLVIMLKPDGLVEMAGELGRCMKNDPGGIIMRSFWDMNAGKIGECNDLIEKKRSIEIEKARAKEHREARSQKLGAE